MKKLLLSAILLLSTVAFGAASGTLTISGTVLQINDIEIFPTADSTNLNIVAGNSGLLVANVSETSNNLTGYTISMRSANASQLIHSVDSSKMTSYQVSYDGGDYVSLTNSDQVVKNVGSLAGLTSDSSTVAVNVTPYATAPAGTYSDVITISIAANN